MTVEVPAGWERQGDAITREFELPSFGEAIAFVQRVAERAEAANHHPDLDIRYRKVRVTLTSHDAGGVTDRDIALAGQVDEVATPG
jgi:4a-hydroxytetrahydrobiopterin dehydratase